MPILRWGHCRAWSSWSWKPPRVRLYELIAEAIDVVVYMSRAGGKRRIEEVLRVTGFDGGSYITEPLVSPSLSLISPSAHAKGPLS